MKQLLLAVLLLFTSFSYSQECDLLILKDGSEISVLITELRLTEIAYKKCDNLNGPLYVVRNQEVFMIKYKNGTSQVIKSEETSENTLAVSMKEKRVKDKVFFEPKRFYVEPEIGLGLNLINSGYGLLSSIRVNAKFGYNFNEKFGAGLLIGYDRLKKKINIQPNYIFRSMTTFAGYSRLCYGGKRLIPYSDFEIGALFNLNKRDTTGFYGTINYERAFYIKPSFGLSFPVTEKLNILASIAYTYMRYHMEGVRVIQWNGQNFSSNYKTAGDYHILSLNFSVRYML